MTIYRLSTTPDGLIEAQYIGCIPYTEDSEKIKSFVCDIIFAFDFMPHPMIIITVEHDMIDCYKF